MHRKENYDQKATITINESITTFSSLCAKIILKSHIDCNKIDSKKSTK